MISVSDIVKLLEQVPIWKKVAALPGQIEALQARVTALEAKLNARPAADTCVICGTGEMKVTRVAEDPTFGIFGAKIHHRKCTNVGCTHTDTKHVKG